MTPVQRCYRHPIDRLMAGCPDCRAVHTARWSAARAAPSVEALPVSPVRLTLVRAA